MKGTKAITGIIGAISNSAFRSWTGRGSERGKQGGNRNNRDAFGGVFDARNGLDGVDMFSH